MFRNYHQILSGLLTILSKIAALPYALCYFFNYLCIKVKIFIVNYLEIISNQVFQKPTNSIEKLHLKLLIKIFFSVTLFLRQKLTLCPP